MLFLLKLGESHQNWVCLTGFCSKTDACLTNNVVQTTSRNEVEGVDKELTDAAPSIQKSLPSV